MDISRTAFGAWNGGRFMNYGEALPEERWISLVQLAYEKGIRSFLTADVYGSGAADSLLGKALASFPRNSYCLVGAVGHDFYSGKREGSKGFPRFTNPGLRPPNQFAEYLRMATEKSLERCQTDYFDVLLLHNPDSIGYSNERVWTGLEKLKEISLTRQIGLAPGPANGFTLDVILSFERFGPLIDWTMLILNPLEPWPGSLLLPAAVEHDVKIITRVVDYGGLFHDDVKAGHKFGPQDHRAFRPSGWVEDGLKKMKEIREIAEKYNVTMLQLACLWNLSQPAVLSVVPTLIQESPPESKPIDVKVEELASLPPIRLDGDECDKIAYIGNNKGCMDLKGANPSHTGEPAPDRWALYPDLESIAKRWRIDPAVDLACSHPKTPGKSTTAAP